MNDQPETSTTLIEISWLVLFCRPLVWYMLLQDCNWSENKIPAGFHGKRWPNNREQAFLRHVVDYRFFQLIVSRYEIRFRRCRLETPSAWSSGFQMKPAEDCATFLCSLQNWTFSICTSPRVILCNKHKYFIEFLSRKIPQDILVI